MFITNKIYSLSTFLGVKSIQYIPDLKVSYNYVTLNPIHFIADLASTKTWCGATLTKYVSTIQPLSVADLLKSCVYQRSRAERTAANIMLSCVRISPAA